MGLALIKQQKQTFDQLVDDAVAEAATFRRPSKYAPSDARTEKLSGKMYLQTALKQAGCDLERIRALHEQLQSIDMDRYPWLSRFRDAASKAIRATRVEDGCALVPPGSNWYWLMQSRREDEALLAVECMQLGTTPAQLVAYETWNAVRQCDDCFGEIDKPMAEHLKATEKRLAALNEIYSRISEAWTMSDVEFSIVDARTGLGRLVWKRAPQVSVYPLLPGAEALVAHLVSQEQANG